MSKSDRQPRRDVGFRFLPTDEELVVGYLLSKLIGLPPPPSDDYVNDCNIYGDLEPWEIWQKFRGGEQEDEDAADERMNDLYFFTPLKKRSATGTNIDRSVGTNGGTWHGEDSGREAQTPDGLVSWTVKRFSYRPKKSKGGQKKNGPGPGPTSWIMHEYCLLDRPIPFLGLDAAAATRLVVCRIRKKEDSNSRKRKNNKSPKVIFIDLDEDDDCNDAVVAAESSIADQSSTNKRRKVDCEGEVCTSSCQSEIESCFSEEAVFSYVAEVERCLSEVNEDCCGGGDGEFDEGAVDSYAAELERCLSEVKEDCGGGGNGGDEGELEDLFDAEIEDCLAEIEEEEDCGGGGGDEGELEALFDAEIEDCLAEVEEEEDCGDGGDEGELEALFDAEIEDCLAEVEEEEDCGDEGELEALFDAEIEDCLAEVEEEEDCSGGDDDEDDDNGSLLQVEIDRCLPEEELAPPSDLQALIQRFLSTKEAPVVVMPSAVSVPSY